MLDIAGGIILAVLFLVCLPFIILLAPFIIILSVYLSIAVVFGVWLINSIHDDPKGAVAWLEAAGIVLLVFAAGWLLKFTFDRLILPWARRLRRR